MQVAAHRYPASRVAILAMSAAWSLVRFRLRLGRRSLADGVHALQAWSEQACALLGVRVQVFGRMRPGPSLYVANHRSYLDVPILSAALGTTFVTRADVRTWPVVGAAARFAGAVFVERTTAFGGALAMRELARAAVRQSIVLFPEGTTGGATLPGPFRPAAFEFVRRRGLTITPVTIRYGSRSAYWTQNVPLSRHLRTYLTSVPTSLVAVHVGPPCAAAAYEDAATLRRAVYDAVCGPIRRNGELATEREAAATAGVLR